EEQHNTWDHRDDADSHEVVNVAKVAILVLERVKRDRERALLLAVQVNERPEKIIPHENECECRRNRHNRLTKWKHDAPPHPQVAAAIKPSRLDQRLGHLGKELPEHEYVKR